MQRREFLRVGLAATSTGTLTTPAVAAVKKDAAIKLTAGPHLFLDDYLVDRVDGLSRQVQQPDKRSKSVLDSKTFGTTQPYVTVLFDAGSKRFRIWYNRGPAIWHADSADGVHWENPRVAWNLKRNYGASLVDSGPQSEDRARRYKLASWQAQPSPTDKKGTKAGMYVGFSPDGLHWTGYSENPVLPTYPEGTGKMVPHGVGDIVDVYYDAPRRLYLAAVKVHAIPQDGYAPAPRAGKAFRRLVGVSTSRDFLHWDKPRRIIVPDRSDDGLLEFYGMGGMHRRGELTIGLVRVLRDDLACDAGGPRDGIGYTTLAASRDGVNWLRLREPFLDRNPGRGSWNHAMVWGSAAVPVGDELFIYYGGYARGHKVAPGTERQIGLARMRTDRYVAMATNREGRLITRPLFMPRAG